MREDEVKKVIDNVVENVMGYKNPFSVEQFRQKYAFDIRLPIEVQDSTTSETSWAQSVASGKFITLENSAKPETWMLPKQEVNSVTDIINVWQNINFALTNRAIDCLNYSQCDNIYNSENLFRSQDIHFSKNVVFSDSIFESENIIASQRAKMLNNCIRVDDSNLVSSSLNVSWSSKVVNSAFIHDCYDLFECLFCSHIGSSQYCIANMQFEKEEYFHWKSQIMSWVLTS